MTAPSIDYGALFADMTGEQRYNAQVIVNEAKRLGLSMRDAEIAIMTAITESGLQNYANSKVPESLADPSKYSKVGNDGTSVGIFQQQNGWGGLTTAQRLDPVASTDAFLQRLASVENRDQMTPWAVAQKIQVSAFSDGSNYQRSYARAQQLADTLWQADGTPALGLPGGYTGITDPATGGTTGGMGRGLSFPNIDIGGVPIIQNPLALGQDLYNSTIGKVWNAVIDWASSAAVIVFGVMFILVGLVLLAHAADSGNDHSEQTNAIGGGGASKAGTAEEAAMV